MSSTKRLIRLYSLEPPIITAAEYAQAIKEIEARVMVGEICVSDRICFHILKEYESRYLEIKDDHV